MKEEKFRRIFIGFFDRFDLSGLIGEARRRDRSDFVLSHIGSLFLLTD